MTTDEARFIIATLNEAVRLLDAKYNHLRRGIWSIIDDIELGPDRPGAYVNREYVNERLRELVHEQKPKPPLGPLRQIPPPGLDNILSSPDTIRDDQPAQ